MFLVSTAIFPIALKVNLTIKSCKYFRMEISLIKNPPRHRGNEPKQKFDCHKMTIVANFEDNGTVTEKNESNSPPLATERFASEIEDS